MKNRNLLRFVGILSLFAILFSSCSKDSLSRPQNQNQASHKNLPNDPGPDPNPAPQGVGSVIAILSSSTTAVTSLQVINNDTGDMSKEIFADMNGNVIIDNLIEGKYTVIARAYVTGDQTDDTNPTVNTITINNVSVIADQVTDLGTISFD